MNQATSTKEVLKYSAAGFSTYVQNLNGPQLVQLHSDMLHVWQLNDGDNTYGTVKRFATPEKGRERVIKFNQAIQDKIGVAAEDTPAAAEETTAPGNNATAETTPAAEEQIPANESEEEMAKRKKAAAKKPGKPRQTDGTTIRELTDEYNKLVAGMGAKAKEAAPYARHHKSLFESKVKAEKQLKRLRKDLGK